MLYEWNIIPSNGGQILQVDCSEKRERWRAAGFNLARSPRPQPICRHLVLINWITPCRFTASPCLRIANSPTKRPPHPTPTYPLHPRSSFRPDCLHVGYFWWLFYVFKTSCQCCKVLINTIHDRNITHHMYCICLLNAKYVTKYLVIVHTVKYTL